MLNVIRMSMKIKSEFKIEYSNRKKKEKIYNVKKF